jgi:Protein of unknown function (DUF3102)
MQSLTPAPINGQADPRLAEHVAEIRALGRRVIADVIEIGRRLVECREIVGHGHWHDWLEAEFRWSDQTALNYMRVYEMSKSKKFLDFAQVDLPVSALYLLAAPSTSDAVRTEILNCAKAGESFSIEKVKEAVAGSKDETVADDKPPCAAETASATPINPAPAATSHRVNSKPPPDIVNINVEAVRRRIGDAVCELNRRNRGKPTKCRAELERLFVGLIDAVEDFQKQALPPTDEDEAASSKQRKAINTADEGPVAANAKLTAQPLSKMPPTREALFKNYRRLNRTALEDRILEIRRAAVDRRLADHEWRALDRMRARASELPKEGAPAC